MLLDYTHAIIYKQDFGASILSKLYDKLLAQVGLFIAWFFEIKAIVTHAM